MAQKGFAPIFLVLIGILVIAAVGGGAYYFIPKVFNKSLDMPVATDSRQAANDRNVSSSSQLPELKGFPVYPNAKLTTNTSATTCGQKQQLQGFNFCDTKVFSWVTNDDFDQVGKWYANVTKQLGWHCNGGAGEYASPRSASVFGDECAKDGDSSSYELGYIANSKNTEITLNITLTALKVDTGPEKDQTGFAKRNFGTQEKFFSTQDYPSELLNINEDELVDTRCTPLYSRNGDSYSYYDGVTKKQEFLFDANLIQIIKKVAQTLPGETVSDVQYCETKQGTNLISYEVEKGGGGIENKVYFALVLLDQSIKKVTVIPNQEIPYFACQKLLEWTMSDIVYYQCGGGDGGFGAAEIYAFNLMTGDTKRVIRCTSQASGEGEQLTLTCN